MMLAPRPNACGTAPRSPLAPQTFPGCDRDRCFSRRWMASLIVMLILSIAPSIGMAQSESSEGNESHLDDRQSSVAKRYQRLEELLLRLADMEAVENPERASLLRRAAKMSRDKFVLQRLQTASDAIEGGQYKDAIDSQTLASTELRSILKLLQSEDRSQRIRNEKERYKKLISDLKRNLNNQRSTRARTENGSDLDDIRKQQESITQKSAELRDRLESENDPIQSNPEKSDPEKSNPEKPESEDAPSDSADSDDADSDEPEANESQSDESNSRESESDDSEPHSSESKDSPPGESPPDAASPPPSPSPSGAPEPNKSEPQDSPSSPSESGDESSSSDSAPSPPQTPEQDVEQKLAEAIEKMRQAEKELEKSRRQEASQKQAEAEERLRAAIDRLEKILRQLREEEMKRELAKLESRVRKMAAMQQKVLESTQSLAEVPKAQRDRAVDLKAGKLAFEEKKITQEADRALLVLREEGSSVAFPEVMLQIRGDTVRVGEMLAASRIDGLAQGLQEDILATLEEMIAALAKAQRDLEKQQQQEQEGQPPPSGQQEKPLVEALAELKLIRTMETRIQNTTKRYSKRLELGDSSGEELMPLLKDLSDRQRRLYRITRDLVMKRNQ